MRRVCVFCGSLKGSKKEFEIAAQMMGKSIVANNMELVYGGGHVGLMGVIADAVLQSGGKVIGVIPESLAARELAHSGVTDLRVVKSMHERKAMMADLSDAFIALPGGFGTLEEFSEILTWSLLGFHTKPCGLLNVQGYYHDLIKFFDTATSNQFISQAHRDLVLISADSDDLLKKVINYKHSAQTKWLNESQL